MPVDPNVWTEILTAKSPEAWMSIFGGAAYVFYRSGALSHLAKAFEAGISAIISMAVGPDIIAVTGYPAVLVYFTTSVFGFLVLDVASSIVSDKTELAAIAKHFIRRKLGMRDDTGDKNE